MILIFPWSSGLLHGQQGPNPKDYPWWDQAVGLLRNEGFDVYQVSRSGERAVAGVDVRHDDLPLKDIERLLKACDTWVSVDSFAQHLAWSVGKPGVVIFGQSDPMIFGHMENTNLLKSRSFLRNKQWWLWSQTPYRAEAFVPAEEVFRATLSTVRIRARKP